ncbi:MAG: cyclase family protein, partial [Bacteroidetes bacterium]|nr:cyclase family protein [Bacteroidota bacterium]
THTETLGHIDPLQFPISQWKGPYLTHALLLSVEPENKENGDRVITWNQISRDVLQHLPQALVIRTLPNVPSKKSTDYSDSNFPYLDEEIGSRLNECGVIHLLVDLPSVDRESDEGKLSCHHAFWGFPANPRKEATISEMVFVGDEISDGLYCLSLQPPAFEMDAAPSRPILYPAVLSE